MARLSALTADPTAPPRTGPREAAQGQPHLLLHRGWFTIGGLILDPRLKAGHRISLRMPQPMGINDLDSSLRVETLSFEKAADFNPQE